MASSADIAVESALAPLDHVRGRIYRVFGPVVGSWARLRDVRVVALGVASVVLSLGLAVGAPLWLLALGPIVLGVPHIVADLRYLWVQPGHHRRSRVNLLVLPPLVVGAVTGEVAWGLLAAGLALFALPTSPGRRVVGCLALLPALVAAVVWPAHAKLLFAHGHNLLAVALWWSIRPRQLRWHGLVPLAFVVGAAALLSGGLDGWFGTAAPGARSLTSYTYALAPGVEGTLGVRLVVLYAFAQSVHYAIWLRLVPEDARRRPSPRPFRATYRALRADLGPPLLILAVVGALALAAWAIVDLQAARSGYLRFAVFHGHLELAAAALLFAARGGLAKG